jgi:hypothetical protein
VRDWLRPWRDPPGFFLPNCPCCGAGAAAQTYHVFAGVRFGSPSVRQSTNYKWDTGAWTSMAAVPSARDGLAAATPASPGSAFVFGGVSNVAFLTECDGYTPDTWTTESSMPMNQRHRAAGCSISGKCYSMGGWNSSNVAQTWHDQYDPRANTWTSKAALTAARANGAASYIGSKGYYFCGDNTTPTQTNNTFEYDPAGDSWATKSSFPSNEDALNGWTLSGTIYANLGFPGGKLQKAYIVDAWSAGTNPSTAATASYACGASLDNASNVGYFTGGNLTGTSSSTQHFDFVPLTWTSRIAVPTPIQNAGASPA